MAQWLSLCALDAGGTGSVPGWGIEFRHTTGYSAGGGGGGVGRGGINSTVRAILQGQMKPEHDEESQVAPLFYNPILSYLYCLSTIRNSYVLTCLLECEFPKDTGQSVLVTTTSLPLAWSPGWPAFSRHSVLVERMM